MALFRQVFANFRQIVLSIGVLYMGQQLGPAELALVVDDSFQGGGVGKALLDRLCRHAKASGQRALFASIHPQNHRMRHLIHCTAYASNERIFPDMVEVWLRLDSKNKAKRGRSFGFGTRKSLFSGLDLGLT